MYSASYLQYCCSFLLHVLTISNLGREVLQVLKEK